MTKRKPDLAAAYDVVSTEDVKGLYADWAARYDEDLASDYDYVYPQKIASIFAREGGDGPVLDIGCGTGLVGEALAARPIDGIDLSPEMLAAAAAKGVYRKVFEADLTQHLNIEDGVYRGRVSAGTFTEGHLGPEPLGELVRIAAPGALFVIGVNEKVFDRLDFPGAFKALETSGAISPVRFETDCVYGGRVEHRNAENEFTAAVFRRR